MAALIVATTIAVVFILADGTPTKPCTGDGCSSPGRRTSPAAVAPPAPKFRYRTVDREVGYFEATITIVNHGKRPMSAWTLDFTYPGADIHNAWEVVIKQPGENVTITNKPTAAPIPPGKSFEIRFGGAGRPAMPTNCRLNNAPCAFRR
jgi:hypothetical protein